MASPTPFLVDQPPKVVVPPVVDPVNADYVVADETLVQEVVLASVEPKVPNL